MELTPQQKQAVEQKLLDTTKYVQFEIHYTTDPALIGGMVIRSGIVLWTAVSGPDWNI